MPTPMASSALSNKVLAIAGLARGGGCHGEDLLARRSAGQGAKAAERGKSPGNAAVGQLAGNRHALAKAAQDLFIEHRGRRAAQAVIDDKADRVGADVDNGHRPVGRRFCPETLVPAHFRILGFLLRGEIVARAH